MTEHNENETQSIIFKTHQEKLITSIISKIKREYFKSSEEQKIFEKESAQLQMALKHPCSLNIIKILKNIFANKFQFPNKKSIFDQTVEDYDKNIFSKQQPKYLKTPIKKSARNLVVKFIEKELNPQKNVSQIVFDKYKLKKFKQSASKSYEIKIRDKKISEILGINTEFSNENSEIILNLKYHEFIDKYKDSILNIISKNEKYSKEKKRDVSDYFENYLVFGNTNRSIEYPEENYETNTNCNTLNISTPLLIDQTVTNLIYDSIKIKMDSMEIDSLLGLLSVLQSKIPQCSPSQSKIPQCSPSQSKITLLLVNNEENSPGLSFNTPLSNNEDNFNNFENNKTSEINQSQLDEFFQNH